MKKNITIQLKQLINKGFFHLFFSNFLVQFMVFGSQMLVAGILLPEDLGRIKLLQTIIDIAAIVGGGGVIVAILKLIPTTTDDLNRSYILRFSLKKSMQFSVSVFLILNIFSYFGFLSSDKQIISLFPIFSLVILLSPISLILVRYYQALDKFKKISIIQLLTKIISAVFIISLTYFFLVKGYIMGVVLGFFITLLYLLYDLRKSIFNTVFIKLDNKVKLTEQINKLSKYSLYAQIADQLRVYSGLFIANYFVTDRELFGQYSFAIILIQGLGVISSSVQQFLLPKFSKLSTNKDIFFKELKNYERNYFLFAVFIFTIVQLALPFIIDFVFKGKYNESIPFLQVLLIGWLIYSAFTLKGPAFIGLGRLDMSFKISIFVLIIMLPILILLCYYYGIWGIVIGYIIQMIINLILTKIYITRI